MVRSALRNEWFLPLLMLLAEVSSAGGQETEALLPAPPSPPVVQPAIEERGTLFGQNPFRADRLTGGYSFAPTPAAVATLGHQEKLDAEIESIWRLEKRGEEPQALSRANVLVLDHPGDSRLRLLRAYLRCLCMKSGDGPAIAEAQRDLDLSFPSEIGPFCTVVTGLLAFREGQYVLAIGRLTEAIQNGYDNARVRMCRGVCHWQREDLSEALTDFKAAIRHDPGLYEGLWYAAACSDRLGDPAKSLEYTERALGLTPRNQSLRLNATTQAINLGRYDVALRHLDVLIADHPISAYSYLLRGIVRWIDGKELSLVRSDLDRAISLETRDWSFHALRAVICYRQAEYARSLGDAVRCAMVLTRTRFKIMWQLQESSDGLGLFSIGLFWRYKPADRQPSRGADARDLQHKLTALGLKTLWSAACTNLAAN